MISLLNPKIGLFYIALFSQFISVGHSSGDKAAIILTPLIVDGLWYSLIASPKIIEEMRAKTLWIDRISGVFLLFLAVRIVL
ncbi:lysine exporter protein (LYSE/YGGA) precursor [Vibrio sp. JCM 19236]|nr:lysine exporter protein (LYSE/YGGA) precursor [Vibrio sp. JCM 19236]